MSFELDNIEGLLLCEPKHGKTIKVLRNGDFCIGRAHDNDLAVSDPTVSAHHARIYTYLTASYIEDLGSTNGTFINNKRVKKHVLKAGDVIRLGAYELLLREPRGLVVDTTIDSSAAV